LSAHDLEEYDKTTDPTKNIEETWICFKGSNCSYRKAEQEDSGHSLKVPNQKERSLSPDRSPGETIRKCPIPNCEMEYTSQIHSNYHNLLKRSDQQSGYVADYQSDPDSPTRPTYVDLGSMQEERDGECSNGKEGNEDDRTSRLLDHTPIELKIEDHNLRNLLDSKNADTIVSLYGTGVPKASFFESTVGRGTPRLPFMSPEKGSVIVISPRTYQTAQSSLASYTTAQAGPSRSHTQMLNVRGPRCLRGLILQHQEAFSLAEILRPPATISCTVLWIWHYIISVQYLLKVASAFRSLSRSEISSTQRSDP
jgi:hypothetical protein